MRKTLIAASTLAAILAVSMVVTPSAFAVTFLTDAEGDTADPNFDITKAGFNEFGNPYIKVAGEAGGTESTESSPAFAYVFAFTNGHHFAVASHLGFSDSKEGNGADDWHAHRITTSDDAGGHFACLTGADDRGKANLHPHRVVLLHTAETDLDHVATVTIIPDTPTASCPALVDGSALYVDVLDVAAPA